MQLKRVIQVYASTNKDELHKIKTSSNNIVVVDVTKSHTFAGNIEPLFMRLIFYSPPIVCGEQVFSKHSKLKLLQYVQHV